jgi:hypothetical protein
MDFLLLPLLIWTPYWEIRGIKRKNFNGDFDFTRYLHLWFISRAFMNKFFTIIFFL